MTSWTRPLQLAVISYAAASGLFALTSPFWMNSVGRGTALVAGVVGCALSLIVIVGAVKRWTWPYDAVWALLGLAVIAVVIDILRGTFSLTYGVLLPPWAGWLKLLQTALGGALALAMLYARNQSGPWGMTAVSRRPLQSSDEQRVFDVSTPEGRAKFEEIKRHFPQREVVQTDLERKLAIALYAWLRRIESRDPPPAQLWPTPAEKIVLARVRAQLERELERGAGNPHLALARLDALVLGDWLFHDEFYEPLLPPFNGAYSAEQHALWRLDAWLEHELFVEYSDPNFESILAAARQDVMSSHSVT